MDEQNRNLLLATALSFVVILVWFILFPPPEPQQQEDAATAQESQVTTPVATPAVSQPTSPETAANIESVDQNSDAIRVEIDTPRVSGSISTLGGRIDSLKLKDYRESLNVEAETVTLLSPVGEPQAYYSLSGWAPGQGMASENVPGPNTVWELASDGKLTVDTPVSMTWDNGAGMVFTKTISVDDEYMFTVSLAVSNASESTVTMAPYGVIARHGEPQDLKNFFILHEGVIGMADGELSEIDYSDMPDFNFDAREGALAEVMQVQEDGWIGFTDHYWMSVLVPSPGTPFKAVAKFDPQREIYQTEVVLSTAQVAPGQSISTDIQIFAGAKEWEAIRNYERGGINGFLDAIDWGWFFFLTKPIFAVLHYLNAWIGNMGWAIIALTLLIKALLFPLAYKSYVSMAKMKELQPEMEKIKERAGEDREKLQKEMVALYKKEKVNPASGCLPILLQIPIFFSLYKVIFVTLELRHAPWLGPFTDLSAPDPTSIINLFGLFSNAAPDPNSIMGLIFIGILPICLGVSMWLQQKLNPAPTDPTQAMIFAWLPWVFMFMLGSFASGLVVYWIANNVITFSQQYIIMRSQGFTPDVFGNIRSSFKRGDAQGDKK
ncbi:MAG: membrane protein insertase YidC [Marinovum sp.]|nr:membrane protein insertase YidC [Marinovum sp.]